MINSEPSQIRLLNRKIMCVVLFLMSVIALIAHQNAQAQQSLSSGEVLPMGQWLEFKQTSFSGSPILLHLRTGYERAVLMPEPVRLQNTTQPLPGCEIIIDDDIVGFYPTLTFQRESIVFEGIESGTVYEIRVRASAMGMRQPLQINR